MFSIHRGDTEALLLRTVRFRKLLEEARALVDLCRDAEEKYKGDYIFDRQYVVSLVESAIERIGNLVFNAQVLAPKGSDELFSLYDICKKAANEYLLEPSGQTPPSPPASGQVGEFSDYPEFQLLAGVIDWMDGPRPAGNVSAIDVMKLAFDQAMKGMKPAQGFPKHGRLAQIAGGKTKNVIRFVDLENAESVTAGKFDSQNLRCRPLGIMSIGASDETLNGTRDEAGEQRTWSAAVSASQLHLCLARAKGMLLLDVSLMGHMPSDYIFLYAGGGCALPCGLPESFRLQKTKQGEMAWSYDVPDLELERSLIVLGGKLFGPTSK